MADVMEDREDLEPWRLRLYELIKCTKWLDWLLLTKRPENFAKMLPGSWLAYDGEMPSNIWGMTTLEDSNYLDRAWTLGDMPFSVRGLSVEPMLGPISLDTIKDLGIGWVIVGAESGHGCRPMNPDWVRALRDECQDNGIAFFVKQMHVDGKLTKDIAKFPADLQIQQFPASRL